MKMGKTILQPARPGYSPPVVEVGADDRAVIVDFGTMQFRLSAPPGSEGNTIILRVDGGHEWPVDIHVPYDARSLVEFSLREGNAAE